MVLKLFFLWTLICDRFYVVAIISICLATEDGIAIQLLGVVPAAKFCYPAM